MRRALGGLGISLATLLAIACSGDDVPSAGLQLVLDTDMTVPDAVAEVGLYVEHTHNGQRRLVVAQEAKPLYNEATKTYDVKFAATFAVQSGAEIDSSDRIRTRFIAFDRTGAVIGMREARTAVPSDTIRQLRLPVLFVNQGTISDSRATLSLKGDGVGLRQAAASADNDPFTRFRQEGCADEQTRGDDGQCIPIDVALEDLPTGAELKPVTGCFDVKACFADLRAADLNAECTFDLPDVDGESLAVALFDAHGYPVSADADAVKLQPIDSTLYVREGARVRLTPALCARAKAANIQRVALSARCAPKTFDVPTCADWRSEGGEPFVVDRDGGFTPALDAGSDAVVDASDAHSDADTGAPEPVGFSRDITAINSDADAQVSEMFFRLESFAAAPDGMTWMLLGGQGALFKRTKLAGKDDVGVETRAIDNGPSEGNVWLELDSSSNLYLLPRPGSYAVPRFLGPDEPAFRDVKIGNDCEASIDPFHLFTLGHHAGKTLAIYGAPNDPPLWASVANVDKPWCFDGAPKNIDTSADSLWRGSSFGDGFRLPLGDSNQLLAYNPPNAQTTSFASPPVDAGSLLHESLIAIDDTHAVLVSKHLIDASPTLVKLYGVTLAGNQPVLGELIASIEGDPTREAFGAKGVMCLRVGSWDLVNITCVRYADGQFKPFTLQGTGAQSDLHVYGDAEYMYLAKTCANGNMYDRIRLTATPWTKVDSASAAPLFDDCLDSIQP